MRRKLTCFAGLLVTLLVLGLGRASYADSVQLTLTGTGSATWGSDYIYPYYFTIQDVTTHTTVTNVALMCISFDRNIYQGETWDATSETAAAADAGTGHKYYEEAAYFLSLAAAGQDPVTAQLAAWYLFDPNPVLWNQNVDKLLKAANSVNLDLYANNPVYIALDGAPSYGLAQDFVGLTPEPGTWALLGTGLIGIVAMLYFRKRSETRVDQLGF